MTVLGVTLNNILSLNKQICSICQSMYFHTRALRHVRPALTDNITTALAVTLVPSQLDYANSFQNLHDQHQKATASQNRLACIVLRKPPVYSHFLSPNWFTLVTSRIKYTMATIIVCFSTTYLRLPQSVTSSLRTTSASSFR